MTTGPETPALLFFTSARSGPARRMESLLTALARKERGRLKVVSVDVDASQALAAAFGISSIPTLVLLRDRRPVARIEGKASRPQIDAMIRCHLPEAA